MERENSYVLVTGPDNIVWVSIQPLMRDIEYQLEQILTDSVETNDINDLKIIGLRSTHQILDSLLVENKLTKIKDSLKDDTIDKNIH